MGSMDVWARDLGTRWENLPARPLETEAAMPARVDEGGRRSVRRGGRGGPRTAPQVFVRVHAQKKARGRHNSVAEQ